MMLDGQNRSELMISKSMQNLSLNNNSNYNTNNSLLNNLSNNNLNFDGNGQEGYFFDIN